MEATPEIRCESCGRLYAWAEKREGGFVLHVCAEGGMNIRAVRIAERFGQLMCTCGHRTPIDLALIGCR